MAIVRSSSHLIIKHLLPFCPVWWQRYMACCEVLIMFFSWMSIFPLIHTVKYSNLYAGMADTTLESIVRILVGMAGGHSSTRLFFFSISVTLACLNVCNKLLFSQEFSNNLVKRLLTICTIISIQSWPTSISPKTLLF